MKSTLLTLAAVALALYPARGVQAAADLNVDAVCGDHGGIASADATMPWDKLPVGSDVKNPRDLLQLAADTLTEVWKHPPLEGDARTTEVELQSRAAAVKGPIEAALKADLKKYPGAVVRITLVVDNTLPGAQFEPLPDLSWSPSSSGRHRRGSGPAGADNPPPAPADPAMPAARFVVVGALVVGDMHRTPMEEQEIRSINRTYDRDLLALRRGQTGPDGGLTEQDVTRKRDESLMRVEQRAMHRFPRIALLTDADGAAGWQFGERHAVTAVIREAAIDNPWGRTVYKRYSYGYRSIYTLGTDAGDEAGWLQFVARAVPPPPPPQPKPAATRPGSPH
jgi:hypothetical protein